MATHLHREERRLTCTSAQGPGGQRVLLVDVDKRQLKSVGQTLRCLAEQVDAREGLGGDTAGYDLIVTNYDALSEHDRAELARAAGASPQGRLLLLSAGRAREDFVTLFGQRTLTNLVAKNEEIDSDDLIVTVQKILRRDIFGIEKYFTWGVRPVVHRVSRSTDKDRVLAAAEEYTRAIGVQSRMANLFCSVADELITNAVYNAPVDARGAFRYAHRSRTEEVALEPGEEVRVTFCCDGKRLGISASDPFGSLNPEQVQGYLAKCFRRGDDQIDQKQGGAGLGLYYVFESLSHLVVNISPGQRTEIIGLFDIRGSFRDFASRGKSFNIFVGES